MDTAFVNDHDGAPMVCPECNAGVFTAMERQTFDYGYGEDPVELSVEVPVRVCPRCGFEYLDHIAEKLKAEAVLRHLRAIEGDEI